MYTDSQTDGWIDRQAYIQITGWLERWIDDGFKDQTDELWMEGQMDR